MIKQEEIKLDEYQNDQCHFLDHVIWLRRTFERARAHTTGQDFDDICRLQDSLDAFLENQFSE